MVFRSSLASLSAKALLLAGASLLLAGCEDGDGRLARAHQPIPSNTLALMEQVGTTKNAPVLIRAYKKEAEFEIWKLKADGRYTLLKTFPMCRWSGQLGPKRREGDRQVPEGFYTITPGQMNPNSNYYLSFNVGYPNRYDLVHEHGGGSIMVHGACSSAGCFSMTDEQIAEIYAIAREGFAGGQRAIQMQSFPFRMTPENLAKHRADPNIAFWRELKEGSDHFDVTKQEPLVNICGRRYHFNAAPADPNVSLDAGALCPPLKQDEAIASEVSAKARRDEVKVAELVTAGAKAMRVVYADGGQHSSFADRGGDVSRRDALALGPAEIELRDNGKPKPALVQVAAAKAAPAPTPVATQPAAQAAGLPANTLALAAEEPTIVSVASIPAPPARPAAVAGAADVARAKAAPRLAVEPARALVGKQDAGSPVEAAAETTAVPKAQAAKATAPFYKRWLGLASDEDTPGEPLQVSEPAAPQFVAVPLPPRRAVQAAPLKLKPQARLAPSASPYGGLPAVIVGVDHAVPPGFVAYAPVSGALGN